MCDTIIMFNLIIACLPCSRFLDFTQRSTLYYITANLDVKMRPHPAADPHQQEKKTRKYFIYGMFQFAGNIIKNDAKKTDLFPHRVFLLRVEGGCTQVTAKNS